MRLDGGFRLLALGLSVGIAVSLSAGCDGEDGIGPYIDRVEPEEGASGGAVEIIGKRFCGDGSDVAADDGTCNSPPAGFVSFGLDADVVRATVVEWKQKRITVDVPQSAAAGATLIVVTVDGVASNAVDFEVL